MPSTREAYLRHSCHYLNRLQEANALYEKGGEGAMQAIDIFAGDWGNIQAGQAWAEQNGAHDDLASELCFDYSDAGRSVMRLCRHPREMIHWLEAALNAN